MYYAPLVGVVKGVGNRCQQAHNLGGRRDFSHVSSRAEIIGKRWTLYVIHDDVRFAPAL